MGASLLVLAKSIYYTTAYYDFVLFPSDESVMFIYKY